MYSTPSKVRLEAWFDDNSNISVELVKMMQDRATGIINGIIWKRYSLSSISQNPSFIWSQAQTFLASLEELIWAWFLLNKEYWIQDTDSKNNWSIKIDSAYKLMADVLAWNTLLYDVNWNEYPTLSASGAWTIDYEVAWVPWEKFFTIDMKS